MIPPRLRDSTSQLIIWDNLRKQVLRKAAFIIYLLLICSEQSLAHAPPQMGSLQGATSGNVNEAIQVFWTYTYSGPTDTVTHFQIAEDGEIFVNSINFTARARNLYFATPGQRSMSIRACHGGDCGPWSLGRTFTINGEPEPPVEPPPVPTFNPDGGRHQESVTVSLSSEGADVEYYLEPNNWIAYTGPITLTQSDTISARGIKDGAEPSNIKHRHFTINNAPTAVNDSTTADEGETITIEVLSNDTDPNSNNTLTISSHGSANRGSVSCGQTSCSYTAPGNLSSNSSASFTYTVSDGAGGADTATVSISLTNLIEGQVAMPVISPSSGSFQDRQTITITPAPGSSVRYHTGSGTFVNYTSPFIITSTKTIYAKGVRADWTDSNVRTATITIEQNGAPVANDDTTIFQEGQSGTFGVLYNDTDPDQDPLIIAGHTQPGLGNVSCNQVNCNYAAPGNLPEPTSTSFTYTISDQRGGTDTATVTINLQKQLVAPSISPSGGVFDDSAEIVISKANEGSSLFYKVNSSPYLEYSGSFPITSTSEIRAYETREGWLQSETTVVNVVINENAPPVPPNPISLTVDEGATVNTEVLINASDPNDDPLTIISNTPAGKGTVNCGQTICTYTATSDISATTSDSYTFTFTDGRGGVATGTVNITILNLLEGTVGQPVISQRFNPDGNSTTVEIDAEEGASIRFRLNNSGNFGGYSSPFVITGRTTVEAFATKPDYYNSTTVTFEATVNGRPSAVNDSRQLDEGQSINIYPLNNDTDPEDHALRITSVDTAAFGTISCDQTLCVYAADQTITENHLDVINYTIDDGNYGTATGEIRVSVFNVTQGKVPTPTISQRYNPDGNSTTVTIEAVEGASIQYQTNGGGFGGYSSPFVVTGRTDVEAYATKTDYDTSDRALFEATINGRPTAVDDIGQVDEGSTINIEPLLNDTDPENHTLSIASVVSGTFGTITCGQTSCTYTADQPIVQDEQDVISYTIDDGNFGTDTGEILVNVTNLAAGTLQAPVITQEFNSDSISTTVTMTAESGASINYEIEQQGEQVYSVPFAVNDPVSIRAYATRADFTDSPETRFDVTLNSAPLVQDDAAEVNEGESVDIDVLLNDTDSDGHTLTITEVNGSAFGTVTCTSTCIYRADQGIEQDQQDTFTYSVSDGYFGTATGSVVVNITNQNDGTVSDPVIDWRGLDNGNSLVTITTTTTNATIFYGLDEAPSTEYTGEFEISTATQVQALGRLENHADSATVIEDIPLNSAPVAVDDTASVSEGGQVDIEVLLNDSDPDGHSVSITTYTQADLGTVVCTNVCRYTSVDTVSADTDVTFEYTIDDGNYGVATATVTVTIENDPSNDTTIPAPASVSVDKTAASAVLLNWSDITQADRYEVDYRRTDTTGRDLGWANASSILTVSQLALSNQLPGHYVFRIRACDGVNCSENSEVTGTVLMGAMEVPTNIVASKLTEMSNQLRWDAVPGTDNYRIEICNIDDAGVAGPWTYIETGDGSSDHNATSSPKIWNNLEPGTRLYRVRACSGNVCSEASDYSDQVDSTGEVTNSAFAYYFLDPIWVGNTVTLAGIAPTTTVQLGGAEITLTRGETRTHVVSSQGEVISADQVFSVSHGMQRMTMPTPSAFESHHFMANLGGAYADQQISILSKFGSANVSIYGYGGSVTSHVVPQGAVHTFDVPDEHGGKIEIVSDLPILASTHNTRWNSQFAPVPVHNEVYGVMSSRGYYLVGKEGTDLTVLDSELGGAEKSGIKPAFVTGSHGGNSAFNQGQGPALVFRGDKSFTAFHHNDGDNAVTNPFWPKFYFATDYAMPVGAQYLSVVCRQPGVNLTLTALNGTVLSTASCNGSTTSPGKAYFGDPANGQHIPAGAHLQATQPVMVLMERASNNGLTNLMGANLSATSMPLEIEVPTNAVTTQDFVVSGLNQTNAADIALVRYRIVDDQGDGDWRVADLHLGQYKVNFEELPAGNYTLEIEVTRSTGVATESLSFSVATGSVERRVILIHTDLLGSPVAETEQ